MRHSRERKPFRRAAMPAEAFRAIHYRQALAMLCNKCGWTKEYSWYVMRRDEDKCANGGREAFIKKATRLLALNYDGIHTGENPIYSPRLLPESNPLSQPLRYPKEWSEAK